MSAMVMDIGLHFVLEMLGAGTLLCAARLCRHDDCQNKPRGRVRRALASKHGSAALWVTFTLFSSTVTVLAIG